MLSFIAPGAYTTTSARAIAEMSNQAKHAKTMMNDRTIFPLANA